MENIVTAIFEVEAEGYKAFTELRRNTIGTGYSVIEASLLKREGDAIVVVDAFDAADVTSDDTAAGMLVGALVGILGGPLGVLLGAGAGALIGNAYDSADTLDSVSLLEAAAAKLYDGETAIIALVQEEEPAFDAAFVGYKTTIIRHFAVDVMDEVELARKAEADFANQLHQKLRAEKKAEKAAKKEQRKAERKARRAEEKAEREEFEAAYEEASEIARAEFTSSTKEMLGE